MILFFSNKITLEIKSNRIFFEFHVIYISIDIDIDFFILFYFFFWNRFDLIFIRNLVVLLLEIRWLTRMMSMLFFMEMMRKGEIQVLKNLFFITLYFLFKTLYFLLLFCFQYFLQDI